MASGCGCKEAYRFPHTTYPYSYCICSFLQQHPTFCSFFYIYVLHTHSIYNTHSIYQIPINVVQHRLLNDDVIHCSILMTSYIVLS